MSKSTKRKQFHYRRAKFMTNPSRTLQELLEEALNKAPQIKLRKEIVTESVVDGGDSWQRFINTHRSAMDMQLGVVVSLEPGVNKLLIDKNDDKDEVSLTQIAPPENKEFLESLGYYGINGNHVILLQSSNIRARELENHLNWLLTTCKVIDEENRVFLSSYIPESLYERIENSEVKSVKVGSDLCTETVPIQEAEENFNDEGLPKTKKVRFAPKGLGFDVLKLIAPERLQEIDFSNLDESSNIEVFVEVKYKRQTDNHSQKALNQIASALRHTSEEDIFIELKGAGTISGNELRVKAYKSIATLSGHLDVQDVFDQMSKWLIDLIEGGLVDSE